MGEKKYKYLQSNSDILFVAIFAIFDTTRPAIVEFISSPTCCNSEPLPGNVFSASDYNIVKCSRAIRPPSLLQSKTKF
jgi:hypothetical protein